MSEWSEHLLHSQNYSWQGLDTNAHGKSIVTSKVEDLEARLVELVKLVEISEGEAMIRANFRHCSEKVLVKYFPSVEIQPFGSTACVLWPDWK